MEDKKNNCSYKEHKNNEAINYCFKCQIYLCNKCMIFHKSLFDNHPLINTEKIKDDLFTGFCDEGHHNMKLEYYCRNHNKLCCGLCLCKIKDNGYGQHFDCNICSLKDIKEEKKSKLKDNIQYLEELSIKLDESIENFKIIFEKINESKEKIKKDIQNIFTKLRNELNNKEELLLKNVDNYFFDKYNDENIIKNIDKLPNKIKESLEKGKSLENKWAEDNRLDILINDCINIENHLNDINVINDKIKKYKQINKINHQFLGDIDNFVNKIKKFGIIFDLNSLILKEPYQINKFFSLIDIKINNMNLLYRASRDGFNYLSIVNKINNKSNLIFLYLTGADRIFGAYIKTKLENIDLKGTLKAYKDEKAFAFSLNLNKKYKILIPEYAIRIGSEFYILIGNNHNWNGFYYYQNVIYDKELLNEPKIYNFEKNSELTEGSGKLTELEIFEINQ